MVLCYVNRPTFWLIDWFGGRFFLSVVFFCCENTLLDIVVCGKLLLAVSSSWDIATSKNIFVSGSPLALHYHQWKITTAQTWPWSSGENWRQWSPWELQVHLCRSGEFSFCWWVFTWHLDMAEFLNINTISVIFLRGLQPWRAHRISTYARVCVWDVLG